jgi:hypothetical protein
MASSPCASSEVSRAGPRHAFLAATSLTRLKPLLRRAVRPVAGRLYEAGLTANQDGRDDAERHPPVRRPAWKVDRSIVLSLVAIGIAACSRLPEGARFVLPALCLGLAVTMESLALRAGRAGDANRAILWILTAIIGVSGRSLALTRIWSR